MRAPAFGPGQGSFQDGFGQLEEIPKFQGLHKIGITESAVVHDLNSGIAKFQLFQFVLCFHEQFLIPEYGTADHHHLLKSFTNPGGGLVPRSFQEVFHPDANLLRRLIRRFRNPDPPDVFEDLLSGSFAEDQDVEQGIAPQTVGPMHGYTGTFSGRIEAREQGLLIIHHHTAIHIRGESAHGIMARGLDRNGLSDRIGPEVRLDEAVDLGEFFKDLLLPQVTEIQVDVILAGDPPFIPDLRIDGPGDHIPRCDILHGGGISFHEAFPIPVDQNPPFASCRFGDQDPQFIDPRGVKLHKLHILERNSGLVGHDHSIACVG